jgi:hypothetical protein
MSCPTCGKAEGHWSNCVRDLWEGLPDPPERTLADLEAEVDCSGLPSPRDTLAMLKRQETASEDRHSREISEGLDVQDLPGREPEPDWDALPIQGERVRVPDGREGICSARSPGKDNVAPWALVDFGNEYDLEAYDCAVLTRLPE